MSVKLGVSGLGMLKSKNRKISRKYKASKPTKYRASLVPGTVLIILAGRYRGKRVVLLKRLDKGVLVITGPFKINGVPIRRINASYVIATSVRIDLPDLPLENIDKDFFAHENKDLESQSGDNFKQQKDKVNASRLEHQKKIDSLLVPVIKQTAHLKDYLSASFSLSKADRPHLMKF